MTGWRIGFAAGPADDHRRHGQDPEPHDVQRRAPSPRRRASRRSAGRSTRSSAWSRSSSGGGTTALMKLSAVPGISCFKPQGAFYLFPNVSSYFGKEADGVAHPQFLRHGLLPPEAGPGGHRPRGRVRRGRPHPPLLLDIDGEPGKGHGPHRRGPGEAQDGEEDEAGRPEQHGHQGPEVRPGRGRDRDEDARRPGRRDGRPPRLREHLRVERQHRRGRRPA